MIKSTVGIIGFGNMGRAIGTALASRNKQTVYFYDVAPKKEKEKNLLKAGSLTALVKKSGIIILAIKPQDAKAFLEANKNIFIAKKPLFITIAAGLNTKFFEKYLAGIRVIRAMPNLAARIGESISFICKGRLASGEDIATARMLFGAIGKTLVINESFINQATAVAGCGPGFIYHIMDAVFRSAAISGFDKETAKTMVTQTFLGAAELAASSDKDFHILAEEVTSKKGMTEAGRKVFKRKKIDRIIDEAITAACKRGEQIAKLYS